MFKPFAALIHGYHFAGIKDLFESQFPSAKYHVGLLLIITSALTAQVELSFGFKMYTLVAFFIGALLELGSGIYANVIIGKQPFESSKLGRWALKFVILMLGLFVLHSFARQWIVINPLVADTFQWIYAFVFTEGAMEYTLSIFENYALISGKPKDYYITLIKSKVDSLLKIK